MYSGLVKFSSTRDWNFGVEPVQLIVNPNVLTKAGSVNDELRVEKTAGQTDALVIALGAYEGTGANRNGDIFKEAACESNYKTFLKTGKCGKDGKYDGRALNRHHKNKPDDPKYGNIKAAAYNKKMRRIELVIGLDNDKCAEEIQKLAEGKQINVSMACKVAHDVCFVAGSLVETERGLIPIEQVLIGDLVKTHTGAWRKVINVFEKSYTGMMYSVDAHAVPFTTQLTENHPVYVLPGVKVRNGGKHGRGDKQRISYDKIDFSPEWLDVAHITEDDYLLYPVSKSDNSLNLDRHAYALGLYLGDGSIIWSKGKSAPRPIGISWTLDEKDVEIVDNLIALYPLAKKYHYAAKHCYNVCLRDEELASLAYTYCGVYSAEKFIHGDLLSRATVLTRQRFISGYMDSDGSIDLHKKSGRIGGINMNVLYSLRGLALSLGIPCGWQKSPLHDYQTGKLKDGYCYSVHIGASYCTEHLSDSIKIKKYGGTKSKQQKAFIHNEYFVIPVLDIDSSYVENNKVFNLQVDVDESYNVHGFAVHNCTWCGHAAKDDKSRCEHIPVKLGEINKQGEMCSMDNINPRWFELSIVGRPADRIGMSLKLASDKDYVKTADDYAQLYPGFVVPDDDNLVISKYASDRRTLVKKIAAIEKRIEGIAKMGPKDSGEKYLAEEKSKLKYSDGLSDDTIDELRQYEPAKLLRALADHGIIFSPEDFIKYLFGAKSLGFKSTNMFEQIKEKMPSMFSNLLDNDDVLHNDKYEPAFSDFLPKDLLKTVKNLFEDHSLFEGPANGRIMKITIIKGIPKGLIEDKKSKAKEEKQAAFDELAEQYAAYKLAAFRYLDEQGKLDDDIIFNSLLQNR